MELKCVIVDDEKSCRDQLRTGLAAHCTRLTVAAEAPSIDFDSTGYELLSNGARREVSRSKKQSLLDFMKERNVVS